MFVKNTIFKSKIYGRSELEIKEYFKELFQEIEKSGLIDSERYLESRKRN